MHLCVAEFPGIQDLPYVFRIYALLVVCRSDACDLLQPGESGAGADLYVGRGTVAC